jgi:hypothetical protein
MQVTHQNEHVTHAVIGGKQTIDFGISSSAEFFNILSSTLYSDQILAVVREVLCNAWDAHIEAGCTDKPVEVTLTNDKFVIKDFGKGIHHDDMGLIYGTYGNSTKKNDGKQTGGFGLGCKAPFAYTDHFEVISCHDGIKTIYTLSKSSAQAQGKPGITPIASFPTEDTGLQVSIRVKNLQDHGRFLNLIHRITSQGDMNVSLNGELVEKIGFDASQQNYTIRLASTFGHDGNAIKIRYGNVVYPVTLCQEIGPEYNAVLRFLNSLGNGNYAILFQAAPHSISVTPSRESLSMQEHTINSLKTLFNGFLDMVNREFHPACLRVAKETVEKAVTEKRIGDLLNRQKALPIKSSVMHQSILSTVDEMAQQHMALVYPGDLKFHKEDIKHRLEMMVKANLLQRGSVQSYLRDLEKVEVNYTARHCHQEQNSWLHRKVFAPLVSKLMKAGLDTSRLYVCDNRDVNCRDAYGRDYRNSYLVPVKQACPAHHIATLPYLRNIVVLATAKSGLIDRVFRHEVFKQLGREFGFLFYHVGMKAADKEAAVEFFKTSGMEVVDLTFRQDWEEAPEPRTTVKRNPTKKGVVLLSALKDPHSPYRIDTRRYQAEDAARTEDPKFIVQVSFRSNVSNYELETFNSQISALIVNMFGDQGGICNSTSVKDGWKAKGCKALKTFLEEKVCEYINASTAIKEYWEFHPERVAPTLDRHDEMSLIRGIYRSEQLRKKFSLINNLTQEDLNYLALWNALLSTGRYYARADNVQATSDTLNSIPLHQANTDLVKKISGNPLLGILDIAEVVLVLNSSSDQALIDKTIAVIDTVIS